MAAPWYLLGPSEEEGGLARWREANGHEDSSPPPGNFAELVAMAYELIRGGYTELQARFRLSQVSQDPRQVKRAFQRALWLSRAEQRRVRSELPELVMALRLEAIRGALADRQWGQAAGMLRDAGAVAGELSPSNLPAEDLDLNVRILPETGAHS